MTGSESLADSIVSRLLAQEWGLDRVSLRPHHRGMNSRTWLVEEGGAVRWVVKAVPVDAGHRLAAGLRVAAHVEASGVPAGSPEPTREGTHVVAADGQVLALLRFVPGSPLTGDDPGEQRTIGVTLATAHRALAELTMAGAERFHWIDPGASHLGIRDWLRPAIADTLAGYDRIPPSALTWRLLHTDPAPEAFRLDPETGRCGVIDWGTAMLGPLLYDLASAVMYVGGPHRGRRLIGGYLSEAVLSSAEVERALLAMLRFRWTVQADYFARRITGNDLTGIATYEDNERGLEDARRALDALRDSD
jgi:Ser/Thr protein kinase RdoA (MazF antagonist)